MAEVGKGLTMVARRAFQQKVNRLASLIRTNAKTMIVVNGKVEGVPTDKIIAALDKNVSFQLTENRLYLVRK